MKKKCNKESQLLSFSFTEWKIGTSLQGNLSFQYPHHLHLHILTRSQSQSVL